MPKKPKRLLTKKKSQWAENRDVNLLGSPLNYNAAVQSRYKNKLLGLVNLMVEETQKEIKKLFGSELGEDYFTQDESLSSQARILTNKLASKFDQLFALRSKTLSKILVQQTYKASKTSLHSSLKELSGGLSLNTGVITPALKEKANAIIAENVSLIKSIPQEYFKNITGAVMRSIEYKGGLQGLIKEVRKYSTKSHRRVELLALDQTRKAYNTINAERLKTIGVKKFKWLHSGGGQHPRQSHIKLGKPPNNIFNFDDLPIINQEQVDRGYEAPVKGIPGQAINCRCVMGPVINLEDD